MAKTVTLRRDYSGENGGRAGGADANARQVHEDSVDAILAAIIGASGTDTVNVSPKGIALPPKGACVDVDKTTLAVDDVVVVEGTGEPESVTVSVSSTLPKRTTADLLAFVAESRERHTKNRSAALGSKLWYFEDATTVTGRMVDASGRAMIMPAHGGGGSGAPRMGVSEGNEWSSWETWERAPKVMSFTSMPFRTDRSMNNLFGESAERVGKRVEFFTKNRDWYKKMGVPYTLGILMHGPPGCGKTSVIKAIAHDTKRHVFSIKLRASTTVSQLRSLFQSDEVIVQKGSTRGNGCGVAEEVISVPVDRRLIVIEDADCTFLPKLLGDRAIAGAGGDRNTRRDGDHPEKPTLGDLLNLLDGVLENPGRIVIITTNYPDELDPALTRPGRLDLCERVGKCSAQTVVDMVFRIAGVDLSQALIEDPALTGRMQDAMTPAQVSNTLFSMQAAGVSDPAEVLSALGVEIGRGAAAEARRAVKKREKELENATHMAADAAREERVEAEARARARVIGAENNVVQDGWEYS